MPKKRKKRPMRIGAAKPQPQRQMLSVQAIPEREGIRTATLFDQEHTIIPCVALVEGVLWPANAPAPELALAEEFGRFPDGWNGRPVVLNHPRVDDAPVSANSPGVLEGNSIGQLFNTRLEGTKLKTELWINNARVEELGGDFKASVDRLKNGDEVVEVSTGLFALQELIDGEFDGEEYESVWRNIVPDHLAILPEGLTGACSVEDGCGAPRTNLDGTPIGKDEVYTPVMRAAVLNNACTCHEPVQGTGEDPSGEQQGIFKRILDVTGNVFRFRDNSENVSDSDIHMALNAALTMVEERFFFIIAVFHGSEDSGRVVYEVGFDGRFFSRDFSIAQDGNITLGSDARQVRPVTQFVPVEVTTDDADPTTGDPVVTDNEMQENAMTKKQLVKSLIDNEATKFTDDDEEWLLGLEEAQLQKMAPEADDGAPKPKPQGGEDPDDGEEQPAKAAADAAADAEPVSTEQYIKDAPEEIRDVLQEGLSMQRQRKDALIKGLVANKRCRFSEEDLKGRKLAELENMASLAQVEVSYEGSAPSSELRDNEDDHVTPAPLVFEQKAADAA